MNRLTFDESDPRFTEEVRLLGIGRQELMPPGFVLRRKGLRAFLLVLFHHRVIAELDGRRVEIGPETMVLWDRHRPHCFGHPMQPWSHSWVVFSGTFWNDDLPWLRELFEQPRPLGECPVVGDGFARLLREFNDMPRPYLPVVAGNIQLLLRELGRDRQTGALTPDPVQRACRWMAANLARKVTVGDVARQAGLSPSRLQQLFRQRLACSVQVWLERLRLQEVKFWLTHSGLTLGEIAQRTGFADGFYLSRRFRRAFGHSPARYRKELYGQGAAADSLPRSN